MNDVVHFIAWVDKPHLLVDIAEVREATIYMESVSFFNKIEIKVGCNVLFPRSFFTDIFDMKSWSVLNPIYFVLLDIAFKNGKYGFSLNHNVFDNIFVEPLVKTLQAQSFFDWQVLPDGRLTISWSTHAKKVRVIHFNSNTN